MADSNEFQLSKGEGQSKPEASNSNNTTSSQVLNDNQQPLDMLLSDFLKSTSRGSNKASHQSSSGDLKSQMIDCLVKDIRQLQQKVKEQKAWAQRVVTEAATRVSNDHMELLALRMRMEKAENEKPESMTRGWDKARILQAKEVYYEQTTRQAWQANAAVRRLETQNAELKADIEAYKLSNSESDRKLQEVKKRGKKVMKKLVNAERQTNALRSQYEKEQVRKLQIEQKLDQADKEAEETEVTWRNEIKKKEQVQALVARETKKLEAQKSKSRAHLLNLQCKAEAECQLPEDECRRLEDKLARLHMSTPAKYSLPDNLDFLYNFDEVTSSGSTSQTGRALSRWICVVCMQNEVSVVFLPCNHHVLCFPCFERICSSFGSCCPSCGVEVEEVIKVHGRGA